MFRQVIMMGGNGKDWSKANLCLLALLPSFLRREAAQQPPAGRTTYGT
jgi:hypothetical protein